MNGTMKVDTVAMRFSPPMSTIAVAIVTIAPATTVQTGYVVPKRCSPVVASAALNAGLKKRCTADVMPCICVIVPMPNSAARVPNTANITARGFHLAPRPLSM